MRRMRRSARNHTEKVVKYRSPHAVPTGGDTMGTVSTSMSCCRCSTNLKGDATSKHRYQPYCETVPRMLCSRRIRMLWFRTFATYKDAFRTRGICRPMMPAFMRHVISSRISLLGRRPSGPKDGVNSVCTLVYASFSHVRCPSSAVVIHVHIRARTRARMRRQPRSHSQAYTGTCIRQMV